MFVVLYTKKLFQKKFKKHTPKTYRLTSEMVALLASGKVRANGIIATTFTQKAAAESFDEACHRVGDNEQAVFFRNHARRVDDVIDAGFMSGDVW